jgi:glutathione S-transferase
MSVPILYSFRRCPYAMRARLAIAVSGMQCELREVVLKDKPTSLLKYSPKGTVPVLIVSKDSIIEESLEIMYWALEQHDPQSWLSQLSESERADTDSLITNNDGDFKYWLDHYKYADRYPENTEQYYREQGEKTLLELEKRLSNGQGLIGAQWTLADIALLPFIRQFAFVDKTWFDQAPYPNVRCWLNDFLDSALFKQIMPKFAQWQEGDEVILFP